MNKETFAKLFQVGEVIDSGGASTRKDAAQLKVLAIEDEFVRYQSLKNKQANKFRYSYLEIVLRGFDRINPKSIQPTIQQVFIDAGQKKNYSTENYIYGFAREVRRKLGPDFTATYGDSSPALFIDDFVEGVTKSGQGFATSPLIRMILERYSVEMAIRHFESRGYVCKEFGKPFDLEAKRGEEVIHVEVKGTQTAGATVILTKNEVWHNHIRNGGMALFIVSSIVVSSDGRASGGEVKVIDGWVIDEASLSAIAYMYDVPDSIR